MQCPTLSLSTIRLANNDFDDFHYDDPVYILSACDLIDGFYGRQHFVQVDSSFEAVIAFLSEQVSKYEPSADSFRIAC